MYICHCTVPNFKSDLKYMQKHSLNVAHTKRTVAGLSNILDYQVVPIRID